MDWLESSNRSANLSIHETSDPSRRVVLLGGIGVLAVGALAPWLEAVPPAATASTTTRSTAAARTACS